MVSEMVQVRLSVGTAQNGSMNAVPGSGMASMSLASMLFQPRIDDPSNPSPSAKDAIDNSAIGIEKCCQVPKVSTNLISAILAPAFAAMSNALFGVLIILRFLSLITRLLLMILTVYHWQPQCRKNSHQAMSSIGGMEGNEYSKMYPTYVGARAFGRLDLVKWSHVRNRVDGLACRRWLHI